MAQEAPSKVIRPGEGWPNILSWAPQDVLELTLGEPGVYKRLDRAGLEKMGLQGVADTWKVGPPVCTCTHAGQRPQRVGVAAGMTAAESAPAP